VTPNRTTRPPSTTSLPNDASHVEPSPLLAAALEYARRGWPVVPCKPGGKAPLGELAPHGFLDATTDRAQVEQWWGDRPDANVAVANGHGADALDVDGPKGEASLGSLLADVGIADDEAAGWAWDRSGREDGGRRAWFRTPAGCPRRDLKAAGYPGLAWLGRGGYTVAPPSQHPSGRVYTWLSGEPPEQLPEVPAALAEVIRPAAPAEGAHVRTSGGEVDRTLPGGDFIARTTWAEVLEPHGWTLVNSRGGVTFWRRPGKAEGISASTGYVGADALYVFSTSAAPLGAGRSYTRFGALAALEHGGDFSAAAAELRRRGYGQAPGSDRLVDGASFILDVPREVPAIWGRGQRVLWARGESLLLVGPDGVGKTTLAGQLALARLALRAEVLGLPVTPTAGRVLYLACDRPAQVARSFARMVTEADREVLRARLVVWRGPPASDFVKAPETLVELAGQAGADTVIVDSLKDVADGLDKDQGGAGYNRARQRALAEGVELLELHHQRKATTENRKPTKLADVYGSRWLTAGAGSVALLWGEPGDPMVDFGHLKQPAEEVGPFRVLHDHDTGASTVTGEVDLVTLAAGYPNGVAAVEAARAIFEVDEPRRAQVEKARRRLEVLCKGEAAPLRRLDGLPVRYVPALRVAWSAGT
jgi:replicative DNA helicase